ncbi:unnamed protein product [Linum tenue]|uniref:DUF674 domain-containing protein n=1 Tax=Linum tenue TaxID=586396 RepID=A0AAV0PBI7_9ROSI|nr:unnamed protein product [Linum tenue]
MATPKVTLKLLINKKTNKVLFAEAGKDFVDFLFTLLSFPLGTVIKLLSKNRMVGCLGNLYQSIEELGDAFFQPKIGKATVLNPKIPFRPSEGGFVKGVITYMVMDNLEVKPMSTISSITMLNKFNVQEVGALEEKVIELGMDEGLNLLKASLQSQTVLTNVFLGA